MSGLFDHEPSAAPPPPGGLIVGVDEAGLGPNLGPLVIGVSVWRTRGEPWPDSQWSGDPIDGLPGVLSRTVRPDRLCIADSKAVYAPGGGLGELSRSARTALAVCGQEPDTLRAWLDALGPRGERGEPGAQAPAVGAAEGHPTHGRSLRSGLTVDGDAQPWFGDLDMPLPDAAGLPELAAAWREAGAAAGLELVGLHADVLFAPRFNADLVRLGGKGRLLTGASLGLLAKVWDPATAPPTRVECDKHGGRNFYAAALAEAFDELPAIVREGAAGSEYTLYHGRHRLGFRPRNEAFGPVALASLVAKFTRELLMERFNAWWADRVPGLRPTAGYPVDAQRFRADTAAARDAWGIGDEAFWRAK